MPAASKCSTRQSLYGSSSRRVAKKMDSILRASPPANEDDLRYLSVQLSETLAKTETRSVSILRIAVISALLLTAGVVSVGVYVYTRNEERDNFTSRFEDSAYQVMDSFHVAFERNLGAVGSLSNDFTSYAVQSNSTFPFVTLPDFALRGSQFRAQSGSHIVHWTPLVTDEKRTEWEEYALQHRGQIDEAYDTDLLYRTIQNQELKGHLDRRNLEDILEEEEEMTGGGTSGITVEEEEEQEEETTQVRNLTILSDGTGFHPRIWSNGALMPEGDEPDDSGPFLPTWQRSPISKQKQGFLNMNWAGVKVMGPGLVQTLLQEKKAVLRMAAKAIPKMKPVLEANLRISQYREHVEDFMDGYHTFLAYPVFDKFGDDQEVAGILTSSIYWKILLSHLLPTSSRGIICVLENSSGQVFAYRLDGPEATYLGMGDPHDPKYDDLEVSENINEYISKRASPRTRAYTTVSLSDTLQYTMRVFPSQDTEDEFVTKRPIIYTVVVIVGFAMACVFFLLFSYAVEKRQNIMIAKVVENAHRVTATQRELNEFLAHEVRNPLAASLSACSFVTSALNDEKQALSDPETLRCIRDDMDVLHTSLNIINDFLRSMLDIHRADGSKSKIQAAPTNIKHDILEPVSAILYKSAANYEVRVECAENLVVETDHIRLKQVVLNLVNNSSAFMEQGFLCMKATATAAQGVRLVVEDSGPGLDGSKPANRDNTYSNYGSSLNSETQGAAPGLDLCKKLMQSIDGDVWLDQAYDSGVEGYPGARYVIELNTAPLDIESLKTTDSESDYNNGCSINHHVHKPLGSNASTPTTTTPESSNDPTQNPPEQSESLFALPKTLPMDDPKESLLMADIKALTFYLSESAPKNPPSAPTAIPNTVHVETSEPGLPENLSVLFVDDDAVLRKLFMRAVKKVAPSWKIQEAPSGEAALRLCDEQESLGSSFDLIFLDQYMSIADKQLLGTGTAETMRSKGITSTICGLSANDIRDNFLSSGADDFILKPLPCNPSALRDALLEILKKGRQATSHGRGNTLQP